MQNLVFFKVYKYKNYTLSLVFNSDTKFCNIDIPLLFY